MVMVCKVVRVVKVVKVVRIVMVLKVVNGHGNQVGPSAWSRRVPVLLFCPQFESESMMKRRCIAVRAVKNHRQPIS